MSPQNGDDHFVRHEACPKCGSSDALAVYASGNTHCFSCKATTVANQPVASQPANLIQNLTYSALPARKITKEICQKFGYAVGTFKGQPCHVAPYYRDGVLVAQHIRLADKSSMPWLGDAKNVELFGMHLWRNAGGKRVVITEGEIDALTVAQAFGGKWPVVGVPGCEWAVKNLAKYLVFLESFEEVIIGFDNDRCGQEAAQECAKLFSPGRVKIAAWPLKDPNELLQQGRVEDICTAVYESRTYRPQAIIGVDDLLEEIDRTMAPGLPWWLEQLTEVTHGRRPGSVYGIGAGVGVGKTAFIIQQIAYDIVVLKKRVGCIFLEQQPAETLLRIAGKVDKVRYHVPGVTFNKATRDKTIASLRDKVYLLRDAFGGSNTSSYWEEVKAQVRYMVRALGVELIYIDHLTALFDATNMNASLETIMKEMAMLAQELAEHGCIITFISHLSTPDDGCHEEGARVQIKHFKGSRAIGAWAFGLFALERDQQGEEQGSVLRVLKDRYAGDSTGKAFLLGFDRQSDCSYFLREVKGNPFSKKSKGKPQSSQPSDF